MDVKTSEKKERVLITGKKTETPTKYTAKDILDKYATTVIRKDAIYKKEGRAGVDRNKDEIYEPDKYAGDIVLWIPPKNWIRIEFECEDPKQSERWIIEMESSCQAIGLECCVTEHKGGKSQYLNICNINGIPVNYDNQKAKDSLIDTIIPSGAKKELDKTNLGWTLSPVMEHQHWKPKYNGAIHKIIRGTHPLDQKNKYDTKLLKQIEKGKRYTKGTTTEILQNNQWVNDFLINYCATHLLPKGERHHVIEKNLAILIYHRTDGEEIKNRYLNVQERTSNTLRTWTNAISQGRYTDVSPLELKRYIEEKNIEYTIPTATDETKKDETLKTDDKTLQLAKDNFTNPKLMWMVQKELEKQHVGNKTIVMECFVTMANSRLKPSNRISFAVRGGSSEGKTNVTKTCLIHIPENWYAFGTRFTRATIEDDIANYDLLLILEKPTDETVTEVLKQVSEDGMKIWKKDLSDGGKGKLKESEFIPRKTVIYTSTEEETDVELATRFLIGNIESDPERYEKVVEKYKKQNVFIEDAIKAEIKKHSDTWIKVGLRNLKTDFDHILIPYLGIIPFRTDTAEAQRDSKRFVNMIKTIAWLHQEQRTVLDYKGKKILLASVEDGIWADHLTQKSFLESASGISENLQEVYDKITDLIDSHGIDVEVSRDMSFRFIDRTLLQKRLNIKSVNTVKAKCDALVKLNLAEIYQTHSFSRTYIRNTSNLSKHPLIACQSAIIWVSIVKFAKIIYKKWLIANRYPIDTLLTGILIGRNTTTTPYELCDLLTKSNNMQTHFGKSNEKVPKEVKNYTFFELVAYVSEKIDSLSKNTYAKTLRDGKIEIKNTNKKLQIDKIKELKEYCQKLKDQGSKTSYETLVFNFGDSFIEHCKKNKLLLPLPDGAYEFRI